MALQALPLAFLIHCFNTHLVRIMTEGVWVGTKAKHKDSDLESSHLALLFSHPDGTPQSLGVPDRKPYRCGVTHEELTTCGFLDAVLLTLHGNSVCNSGKVLRPLAGPTRGY